MNSICIVLFLLTLISLPSLSFSDDCPFPCLPPPPPPFATSPPPPPPSPSPVYFSPPPPDTPSYWNYPPPPYTPGYNPYFQPPPTGYIYGATPPPPDPMLPYFPWYYHTSASTAATFSFSMLISFVLFALGELLMF